MAHRAGESAASLLACHQNYARTGSYVFAGLYCSFDRWRSLSLLLLFIVWSSAKMDIYLCNVRFVRCVVRWLLSGCAAFFQCVRPMSVLEQEPERGMSVGNVRVEKLSLTMLVMFNQNGYRFGLLDAQRTSVKLEFIARFAFRLWFYFLIHSFGLVRSLLFSSSSSFIFCGSIFIFFSYFVLALRSSPVAAAVVVVLVEIRRMRTLHKLYCYIRRWHYAITYYYYPLVGYTIGIISIACKHLFVPSGVSDTQPLCGITCVHARNVRR